MTSLLLARGSVGHARAGKNGNRFRYPIFQFSFPLEQEGAFRSLLAKQFRPWISLRAEDYLTGLPGDLGVNLARFLREEVGISADQVDLQTFPRMLGYGFNPISLWWCARAGQPLGVLCEVNNTFGERHFYWMEHAKAEEGGWIRAEKVFHVSPFFPVDGFYRFRFFRDAERFRVDITHHEESGGLRLATWMEGSFSPLAESSATSLFLRYGWMTALVMVRIHYQAFRLFLRRTTFFRKPNPPTTKVSS